MQDARRLSRRNLLRKLSIGIPLLPVAGRLNAAWAANAPTTLSPLNPDSKEAKAVKYVEDASKAQGAQPGSSCASCAVYQGHSGAPNGPCQIFPGKLVKATGWCSSWAPQI